MADARSVSDEHLVAAKVIYPDHQRETWTVRPSPAHRWFYKRAQAPDEVVLIKCFDTMTAGEGVARRVPHTAFEDPAYADGEPRESVAIRALLFYGEY